MSSAVVRLKQIAYLSSGATRYLTSAQQATPPHDAPHARLDLRRGSGQYVRLARELTALAPAAVVECATHIAARLPARARTGATVPGMDTAMRATLLDVARGHVIVTEQYEQPGYGHTVSVDVNVLRHLESQGLVSRELASAPPFFNGGPPRDRVRLTSSGLAALGTVLDTPLLTSPSPDRRVPAPATAATARPRR
ncbi:hypothetical protein ACFUIW_16385 [Streptomyces sp. NPDC057245]|uniref:hypothetical protein n=1 Tax=Streptomyces sp. NPDC057245 TaxID=3346065 RepID=UPI00363FE261